MDYTCKTISSNIANMREYYCMASLTRVQLTSFCSVDHDYYLVIWTSVEPCLGVIGACMPAMRPLFAGFSPQSIINSIRSVISLHSLGGRSGRDQQPESEDSQKLRGDLSGDSHMVVAYHELAEGESAQSMPSDKIKVEQSFGNSGVDMV